MPSPRDLSILPLLLFTLAAVGCSAPPDAIYHNARIITMAPDGPAEVEALAVRDGRVLATGPASQILAMAGPDTRTVDLEGRFATPGLIDAHFHFMGIGLEEMQLNFRGTTSRGEIIQQVEAAVRGSTSDGWIEGRGWDQNDWPAPERRFPTASDLDRVTGGRPAAFRRIDGHALWVNSEALRLAGIDAATPDPPGGRIIRNGRGQPTGILVDDAMDLVFAKIPPPDKTQLMEQARQAIRRCLSLGLVGGHDMGTLPDEMEAIRQLVADGDFGFRLVSYLRWPLDGMPRPFTYETLDPFLEAGPLRGLGGGRLWVTGIKMSSDGAMGSRGAALLEPYSDDPETRGLLRLTADEMYPTVVRGAQRGFQTAIHAIGDRANRVTLDVYERALAALGPGDHRFRDEHSQIIAPDDVPRFARTGVIPSMQPTHATSDMPWVAERTGEDRLTGAYLWRTFLDQGLRIPGGSDAPVEKLSPLEGIYAAVTRQDLNGQPPEGWHASERVTREEALRMFTLDAAWAAFTDDELGSLEKGKYADLVVFDRDLYEVPIREVADAKILLTVLGGEIVYRP